MSDNQNRFTFSSPSINNIIESVGYSELNDASLAEQHTGWTPIIKQSMAASQHHNQHNSNSNSNNNNVVLNTQQQHDSNGVDIYSRSNSINTQYQALMQNQMSSPSKMESSNVNLEKLLAFDADFIDNASGSNFPLLLSTTPIGSKTNNMLFHDLFMDTPNLSNHVTDNGEIQRSTGSFESPTKLMQQSLLLSAHKRLTPFKLDPQNQPALYPETPGTKLMRSLLELPTGTTPLPTGSLPRLKNGGSPLKDSITSNGVNFTPLTKKSQQKLNKRKAQDFETPKRKARKKKSSKDNDEEQASITPAKQAGEGSSPSTIKVATVSPTSKAKNAASNQEFSPTPASQKSISSQTVTTTEYLEPPPIGTFKKEEKQASALQRSIAAKPLAHTANGKNGKFQIIFQDVNSLMNKSLIKSKKARSKSGILTANNNKKNRLSRAITYSGIDMPKASTQKPGLSDKENFTHRPTFNKNGSHEDISANVIDHIRHGLNEQM